MSRTGENIYKRKDGRWEGRYIKSYINNGKANYGYVYSKTYSDVKNKLNRARIDNQITNTTANNCLLSDVSERWLTKVKNNCKLSTYNKYRNTYEKIIKPCFGNLPITKIAVENIEAFIILLLNGKNSHKPYSHKTAQEICMILKQIFKYAEEIYKINPQFPLKILHVKTEQSVIVPLDSDNIHKLTRFLLENTDEIKLGILISLYTGIRLGELCALMWEDVNFTNGTIKINKTVQRIQHLDNKEKKTELMISTPKSLYSNRIIPIPQFLLNILEQHKKDENYYILTNSLKCMDPRTMEKKFKQIIEECSVPQITFHTLRHSFATQCIKLGFDVKTLSEILGHSSVNITLNRYVHSSIDQKRKSMDLLSI